MPRAVTQAARVVAIFGGPVTYGRVGASPGAHAGVLAAEDEMVPNGMYNAGALTSGRPTARDLTEASRTPYGTEQLRCPNRTVQFPNVSGEVPKVVDAR